MNMNYLLKVIFTLLSSSIFLIYPCFSPVKSLAKNGFGESIN